MAADQECVDYARECVRLAELTKDLHFGTGFSLRPASGWPPRVNKKVTGQHSPPQCSDGIAALISREPSCDWELPQTKLGDTPI